MTPYELDILLHYYYSPIDHEPRPGDNIYKGTMISFVSLGLLDENKDDPLEKRNNIDKVKYVKTERLQCFIDHICQLKLPEWTMIEESNK